MLGGGPNRIGQGIEFDYCCVHAALALREDGFETIMVNCNPETVSTDYDTSDRLYFEPLTLEDVLEIVHVEKPWGVIVQFGGQTPLKLARDLEANGVPIIGTSPDMIDMAEDRERFQQMLHRARSSGSRRTAPRAPRRQAIEAARGDRLSAGRAAVVRARRPRDGDRLRPTRPRALHARGGQGQQRHAGADRPVPRTTRSRSTSTRVCDGKDVRDRRHHGAHRAGRRALGRLGVLAAAVSRCRRSCRTSCARQTRGDGAGLNVVGLMNVQFAIQSDGRARSTCSR